VPSSSSPSVKTWVFLACFVLILAVFTPLATAGMNSGRREPIVQIKPGATEPTYSVEAGLGGDVFPVFANFASFQTPAERQLGIVTVTITNPTTSLLRKRVTVQVPGWSDQEIQIVEMGTGQVRKLFFAPTFQSRLYLNREIAAATVLVTISDVGSREVYSTTVPVRLRSAGDMYWGKNFIYAKFIASWVTPHDAQVESILMRAKEYMPGRRMPGYETWRVPGAQEKSTYAQARAIYRALQQKGVSYVKSSSTLGSHVNAAVSERVRLPRESLRHVSANCIDGAVLYASLFENLGMDPVIVLVPGHAYVGVRLAQGSEKYLYIETAVTGRATFERSVRSAAAGLAKFSAAQRITIPIEQARQAGIYPMPEQLLAGENNSADSGNRDALGRK